MAKQFLDNDKYRGQSERIFSTPKKVDNALQDLLSTRPKKVKKGSSVSTFLNVDTIEIFNDIKFTFSYTKKGHKINGPIRSIEIDVYNKKHKDFRLHTMCKVTDAEALGANCIVETYRNGLHREYKILNDFHSNGRNNVKVFEFDGNKIELFYTGKKLKGLVFFYRGFLSRVYSFEKQQCYMHYTVLQKNDGSLSKATIFTGIFILAILIYMWYMFNLFTTILIFFVSFGLVNWVSYMHPNLSPIWRGVVVATYGAVFALMRFII